jgi:hypothetical protein
MSPDIPPRRASTHGERVLTPRYPRESSRRTRLREERRVLALDPLVGFHDDTDQALGLLGR